MQTPQKRNGSSEVSQRTSPGTPRSARVAKTEFDSTASKSTPAKTSIDRNPKGTDRRSPRSPMTEKKRPSRAIDLESQLTQLQDDLKKAKDQLGASESWRRRAQQESEEAKKQLSTMSVRLEDSQRQLMDFSVAEEGRLQELRKISQERDRVWQSELEAIQRQHSVDSAALAAAMNEIHRSKQQIEMVTKSESAQAKQSEMARSELQMLKQNMAETVSTVETLKAQLRNSEEAEAEARSTVYDTQKQLEMAKTIVETLHADGSKLMDSFGVTTSELEESRARVNSLEETVKKLQANQHALGHGGVLDKHIEESEVEQLRSAFEAAVIKHQEEQIQTTIQIRSVYESVERAKVASGLREAELELALKNAKAEIFELKSTLAEKETGLRGLSEMNQELSREMEMDSELKSRLAKSVADVAELKADLMDKETELQSISEENELLKLEMRKRETSYEAAITDIELARAAERDALMRVGSATEEADNSSRRAARAAEQLEAAQAVSSEMEAELRRLRVQTDQWRKAAEAAAAALTPPNNGRFVERTSSLDPDYHCSPFSDDLDVESPKKKNSNVLRRIGGLLKKSPK